MFGKTMDKVRLNSTTFDSPEALVAALDTTSREGDSATPRKLRTEEARGIVEMIMKGTGVQPEHLEKIIFSAQKSSETLWDLDDDAGLHAIEYRKLARLYDTILETAEKKLAALKAA